MSKILFLPRENKIHIFKPPCNVLFIIYIDMLMTAFLMISRRFPTTFRGFPKKFQNCSEAGRTLPNIFRRCPKISEDCRRLSRKTRRCFDDTPTNLSTIRDKLDINEIIDKLTCEIMKINPSGPGCIFYEFYELYIFQ